MKIIKVFTLLLVFLLASCSSVSVTTDYEPKTNFNVYKTFAFYKKGIDNALISDIDKKRILRYIESELIAKGMTKSNNPDILVNIFAKSSKRVDVYENSYNGWGSGYYGSNYRNSVSKYTEGTLFIDIIDASKKALVWQGVGIGALTYSSVSKKEKRVKEFVTKIMAKFPPK